MRQNGPSVSSLWFSAQSQLRAGKNPSILAMYNISLSNIRQHNPRFRDYQRRRSQHEKAATYLQVTGDKLRRHTVRRKEIDDDDDENDWSDTEGDGQSDGDPDDHIECDAEDLQSGDGQYALNGMQQPQQQYGDGHRG